MKVEYLFTISRSKKAWGSKLIQWGTRFIHPELTPCSHVAVKMGELVLEATLEKGVDIIPYDLWIKKNKVIYSFKCSINRDIHSILKETLNHTYDKKYDWFGILFFAWRILGFIILNRPLPSVNRWHDSNKFFCVEVIGKITGENYQMMSPIQLVKHFKDLKLKEVSKDNYNGEVES